MSYTVKSRQLDLGNCLGYRRFAFCAITVEGRHSCRPKRRMQCAATQRARATRPYAPLSVHITV